MSVIVFGMENCAGCVTVKTLLKQNGISFTEMDVMNPDHMAEAQKHGIRGVPTTIVGANVIVGSSPREIQWIRNAVGI
jgi:glutaredoxin